MGSILLKRAINQGKHISASDAKFYRSLGELIKDYREWRELSQESFATSLGISVRQLRNWEANRHQMRLDNMHDLAEITGLPMQVCITLNTDQPVWYSLRKRRFALSSLEKELFSSDVLSRYHTQSHDADLIHNEMITHDRHIHMILACHQDIYGGKEALPIDVIKIAIHLLPAMNFIALDCWGHYAGHQICLPIQKDIYEEIKKCRNSEEYLDPGKISDIVAAQRGVFFIYSIFSASINAGYSHNINNLKFFDNIVPHDDYSVAVSSPAEEEQAFIRHLGYKLVERFDSPPPGISPDIYEIELAKLMHPLGPSGALLYMLKEEERKEQARTKESNRGNGAENGVVTVGGIVTVENVCHDAGSLENIPANNGRETCPNEACKGHREPGTGNIACNGTYRTKDGTLGRRFRCKLCGRSFSSRNEGIFSGLRSPQKKVLAALKLLLQGMSLRGSAKILGSNHQTIRRWLTVLNEQKGKRDSFLLKQLEITPSQLETLWSFCQKTRKNKVS